MVADRAGRDRRCARGRALRPGTARRRILALRDAGCGYAALALGLLVFGARRQRELERSILDGVHSPLPFRLVAAFTIGGVLLVTLTVVLVGAQL